MELFTYVYIYGPICKLAKCRLPLLVNVIMLYFRHYLLELKIVLDADQKTDILEKSGWFILSFLVSFLTKINHTPFSLSCLLS